MLRSGDKIVQRPKVSFETYAVENISQGTSFLEMLDILNDKLILDRQRSYCISIMIAVKEYAECVPFTSTGMHMDLTHMVTTCQLHMRRFNEGQTITVEPWRVGAFPVIKDLMVDRDSVRKNSAAQEASYR